MHIYIYIYAHTNHLEVLTSIFKMKLQNASFKLTHSYTRIYLVTICLNIKQQQKQPVNYSIN